MRPLGRRRRLHGSGSLDVDGVAVARGGRIVLDGVSFRLDPGEALAVTGPNGVGKSTLLRALAGLVPLAAGRVAWVEPQAGAAREPPPLAERLHYLGHADGLKTALTARENLAFAAAVLGAPLAAPAEALRRLGLGPVIDLPVAYLSAGQKRRTALARLLVAHRPLWVLDEPATALDRDARASLASVMADHLAAGGLVLAATHARLGLDGARELQIGAA